MENILSIYLKLLAVVLLTVGSIGFIYVICDMIYDEYKERKERNSWK